MKQLTVLMGGIFLFIWSISAQDTTRVDVGEKGVVTVVNKGTTKVITIDTDSLDYVLETVAAELMDNMSIVLDELSHSMDILSNQLENTIEEQLAIEKRERELAEKGAKAEYEEQMQRMKAELEAKKKALKAEQKAMQENIRTAEMEYRKKLEHMEQYNTIKKVYIENRDELKNVNGTVTIEIDEPVLKSSSISQKKNADTTEVKIVGKSVIKVIEGDNASELAIGGYDNIYISEKEGDTVEVRLGKKIMKVTDGEGGSKVHFEDRIYSDTEEKENKSRKKSGKFKGHWSFIELGVNTFTTPDYTMYADPNYDFLELNYNKSVEFNINPFKVNLGIINGRSKQSAKLGIVTGLGFNFNNYTFDNNITLAKATVDGTKMLVPVDLEDKRGVGYIAKKTKLTITYMTVPVLMEFTLPGGDAFISAGAIGAVKLGSHTKDKDEDNKYKGRGDFYLNPFRYGFTAKVGYKGFSLYGNYYISEIFQANTGPLTTPFSVGIGLM